MPGTGLFGVSLKLTVNMVEKALHLIYSSEYGGYRAKNLAVLMFANRPDEFMYAYKLK